MCRQGGKQCTRCVQLRTAPRPYISYQKHQQLFFKRNTHTRTILPFSRTGVDHGDFPKTVLRGLEAFLPKKTERDVDAGAAVRGSRWKIPDDEIAKRRDLRKSRIFTIDPTGARDLDDALSVTPLADGTFEIGVHIADVTYFVRPNSELDREARRRATTVYLVQQARRVLIHQSRHRK